ncbi:MAG TPA: hypothetical protein VH502_04805 [Actinoplanes sp.]|jgi:hypothetical protein
MRVLFLALGGNRRPAVTAESRAVASAGGRPTVLVAGLGRWAGETFAADVDVVPLSRYRRHWPLAIEHLVLYRVPRVLLRRPGTVSLYNRLFANRVRRWLVRPVYGWLWPDGIHRQLDTFLAGCGPFDAVVVSDARSFPAARRAVDSLTAVTGRTPRVAFRVEL